MDEKIQTLNIGLVSPDPNQPRKTFTEEYLVELGRSIQSEGQRDAVHVIPDAKNSGKFLLVNGERRFRAISLIGLDTIKAIVREDLIGADAAKIYMDQLLDNENRQNLGPMENANAWRHAIEVLGVPIEDLSAKLGKSVDTIARYVELTILPQPLKNAIERGELPVRVASELVKFPPNKVMTAFNAAMKNPKSVKTMLKGIEAYRQSDGQTTIGVVYDYLAKKNDPAMVEASRAFDAFQEKVTKFMTRFGGKLPLIVDAKQRQLNALALFSKELNTLATKIEDELMRCEAQKNQREKKAA